MGYPPSPPPPGTPGGYGPPAGGPGYGPPTGPPPGAPPGGYGGTPPPGGYAPQPPPGAGSGGSGGSKSLILLMAALVVVVLLAVVGGLILLNRGGDDEVELTQSQLEQALITEGDVGDGFTVDTEADDEGDSDDYERDEIDASEECIDLYDQFEAAEDSAGPTVEAQTTLDGEDGSQVEENLEQGSEFTLDDVRHLVDTCPEIGVDDGETVGTIRFDIVDDVAVVGDESLTLRLDFELEEPYAITVPSLGVLWERDGTYASVTVSGAIDEETFEADEPDEGLLGDVVETADTKLEEVIDEA